MVLAHSGFIYTMDPWAVAMGHTGQSFEETMASSRDLMACKRMSHGVTCGMGMVLKPLQ